MLKIKTAEVFGTIVDYNVTLEENNKEVEASISVSYDSNTKTHAIINVECLEDHRDINTDEIDLDELLNLIKEK